MSDSDPRAATSRNTIADLDDSDPGDARALSTIGRYVVLDSVGIGGMGLVCAAYDPKLNRKIALKLLRNSTSSEASEAGRNRLFREAQALARLSHPNVVTVHDVDVFEGQVYIAMEFVEGTTLREWLREDSREWKDILEKFILAGKGLAAAHAAGIVHRDFKPSNVLISHDGDVRVADFGVAKERDRAERSAEPREVVDIDIRRRTTMGAEGDPLDTTAEDALIEEIHASADRDLTVAGRMVGTPAYMAPEQHMGLRVGPFTDQYSFCVSMYEALYGRLPFEGADRREQLRKMTEGRVPVPPKEGSVRNVPSWLHKVLTRGLQPQPSDRWPSMEALLGALQRDPARRMRRIAIAAFGALGVTAGVLGFVVGVGDEDKCENVGAKVESSWNEERRAELEAAFLATEQPFAADSAGRVGRTLDGWSKDWRQQRAAVCEATWVVGDQSESLLDLRMSCLDQQLQELDALLEVLMTADGEVIERSVSAAHALSDPAACASILSSGEGRGGLSDMEREQVLTLENEIARATMFAEVDKFDESLPLLEAAVGRARKLGYKPLLGRALYEVAESQHKTGAAEAAEASLREAIEIAAAIDDPNLEAQVWTRLMYVVGYRQSRVQESRGLALAAQAAIIRIGEAEDRSKHKARYENALGAVLVREGVFTEALEHLGRAAELARKIYGEDHPETLNMMFNHAVVLAMQRSDDAEEKLLEVVERTSEVLGPDHPFMARVYLNLGNLYITDSQPEKAQAAIEAALEIREQIPGSEEDQAKALMALGQVALRQEQYEEALGQFGRAASTFRKTHGEVSTEVAVAYTNVGRTQQRLGRYEDASASYDRVAALYEELYPEHDHPNFALLARYRCELYSAAELWKEAAEQCEAVLAMAEQVRVTPVIEEIALETLVVIEDSQGRPQAADRWRERLAAVHEEHPELVDEDEDGDGDGAKSKDTPDEAPKGE